MLSLNSLNCSTIFPDVILLGSSLSERDAEATRAHARTRQHDTLSRFAIWFLRHEVGSLEFKVYLSLIFGYLGIFSVEESKLSTP